jgi:hypothetical protein
MPPLTTKENEVPSASSIRPKAHRKHNLPIQTLRSSSNRLELHFPPVTQTPLLGSVAHKLAVDGAIRLVAYRARDRDRGREGRDKGRRRAVRWCAAADGEGWCSSSYRERWYDAGWVWVGDIDRRGGGEDGEGGEKESFGVHFDCGLEFGVC